MLKLLASSYILPDVRKTLSEEYDAERQPIHIRDEPGDTTSIN